jgi:hypothetical protein
LYLISGVLPGLFPNPAWSLLPGAALVGGKEEAGAVGGPSMEEILSSASAWNAMYPIPNPLYGMGTLVPGALGMLPPGAAQLYGISALHQHVLAASKPHDPSLKDTDYRCEH